MHNSEKPHDRPLPQRDLIALWRCESVLDPHIPLGLTSVGHPERGETVQQYFRKKFQRGEFGKYWLHRTAHYAARER